ncbi:MAG TPA: CDP-diacylglycerol--serine O-phosphatidyltransferase [Methylomirabilota bacterium]|nr:CDP-diacylglycerol--serine O-phosphatidyltransferase [Methylomirabilota bacterium]
MIPSGPPPRHLSMIRGFHLADFLTLGNAACGTLAVFAVMAYAETRDVQCLLAATAIIPLALGLDVLDGNVARWRRKHSAMGRELDSLADVISFGVAPAAIAHGAGMKGLWDVGVLLYFVACGVSRLARFNVTAEQLAADTGKVKYFEGTPIPSSLVLVGVVAACAWLGLIGDALPLGAVRLGPGVLHPLALLWAVSGSLMISKTLRVPKL